VSSNLVSCFCIFAFSLSFIISAIFSFQALYKSFSFKLVFILLIVSITGLVANLVALLTHSTTFFHHFIATHHGIISLDLVTNHISKAVEGFFLANS